jgi:hypothetical protein
MSSEINPSEAPAAGTASGLPEGIGPAVERFVQDVSAALGGDLVSAILYGGLAKGEYDAPTSDVNLLLVLRRATVEVLDLLHPPVQEGRREFGLSLLVLTVDDLSTAADVFPTKFLDLQRCHRVLSGEDVLARLEISPEHLRLRCEQEIRNLQLRLRAFYLQRAQYPDQVEVTLSHAVSSLLNTLAAVLGLDGGKATTGKSETLEAAEARLSLDLTAVRTALEIKHGDRHLDEARLKQLYGEFMEAVRRTAEAVDRL